MMKRISVFLISILLTVGLVSCRNDGASQLAQYKGVVINEVAAHDENEGAATWVEILNTASSDVDLSGLHLLLYDEYFNGFSIHDFTGESLGPGERKVLCTADGTLKLGFRSNSSFELKLAKDRAGECLDTVSGDGTRPLPLAGSWSRIPDGNGSWTIALASTKGRQNRVLTLENTQHNAIWLWSSFLQDWVADDAAILRQMKVQGYDHVLLNYSAFENGRPERVRQFLEAAADAELMVHAWIQCFYSSGKWVSPVVDNVEGVDPHYDQELFDEIIARAHRYIDEFGVQGIHLDYIRFGGTAQKHNHPSYGVTSVGAVTEFCRQIREAMDARGQGIILSAAMMAENGAADYYGQDASKMGQYIHILMPMIYRYQSGGTAYGEAWCQRMAKMFADATDAQVWAGIQTYNYSGTSVRGLDAGTINSDCNLFHGTGAEGIVLFRYGLGTFPDLNGFKLE